jgi:hypothetical protein
MKREPGPQEAQPPDDWRVYRPAIWLGMIGVAVVLLVNPAFIGAAVLGAALGIALKIYRQRR